MLRQFLSEDMNWWHRLCGTGCVLMIVGVVTLITQLVLWLLDGYWTAWSALSLWATSTDVMLSIPRDGVVGLAYRLLDLPFALQCLVVGFILMQVGVGGNARSAAREPGTRHLD